MAKANWAQGVSKSSIGRFGGLRDDCIPYNDGYLTCSAESKRLFLEQRDGRSEELGHYFPGHDYSVTTKSSWTGKTFSFRVDGKAHSVVTRSLLFPGFHHQLQAGVFEYYWRIRNYGPTDVVLPLEGGLCCRAGTDGYSLERDGPLARPWVLLFFAGSAMPFDYPMLLVFDRQPSRIDVWTHEYLKAYFDSKRATVVQVHPFGAQRLDKAQTAKWRDGLPRDVVDRCDFWAAAAMRYPASCREEYQIDEKRGVVRIRDVYGYLKSDCQWRIKPVELAPLPCTLANARSFGYPVNVKGRLRERLCPTFQGWYEAVEGSQIEYDIPLSRYREHTLAPVAIRNNATAAEVTSRLENYLAGGDYLTFSGDDHYDPAVSMDSLHNLRIMAWSLWSIDPEKRPGATEHLCRGLGSFDDDDYLDFTAAPRKTAWSRHKSIFDYKGVIDYDAEWYNGMNLAGLWNWLYFVQDADALKFLRRRWGLIERIFAYNESYCDWSLGVSWTCARGESCWLDGINYLYEGLLGYADLARRLGKASRAGYADYQAAKMEAFVWQCWNSGSYYQTQLDAGGAELSGGGEALGAATMAPDCAAGYYEGLATNCGDVTGWSCGNYSYMVREVMLLLGEMGKRDMIARQIMDFGANFPDWRSDPYKYGKASGYPGSDPRRTIHHYFLDPRLAVCSLVVGENVHSLLMTKAPLTAPVLECILVSMAPRLLVPRSVRFAGSVWDDAAKSLTVTLEGQGPASVMLLSSGRPQLQGARLLGIDESDSRVRYEIELAGPTTFTLQY